MVSRPAHRTRPYTPARESSRDLLGRTVGRKRVLERILDTFRSAAASRNRAHTLLVGPRGSGKSHLLAIALESLRADADLSDRFAVVRIPEDGVGVTRFTDVLDLVATDLAGVRPARGSSVADRTTAVSDALGDRVLLLTIENLDRMMTSIGTKGQQDFRSWIETSGSVLVLATTPALFNAVDDRDEPFFGAFANVPVQDLTVDEGRELVELLARQRGDLETAEFVASETGRARISALSALTGGSPRIWMILADCLDPRSLNELIPAVHELLENLVPYYQQLLWDLPPNEQRIVRALAEGESAALTVSEISELADLSQAVTSNTLKRLTASRWVTSAKLPSGDRRRTWYQLREPLLRHHFQYRAGQTRTLTLIVTMLRALFDDSERADHLLAAPPESDRLNHLAASFDVPAFSEDALNGRDVDALQLLARIWLSRPEHELAGREVDALIVEARAHHPSPEDLAAAVSHGLRRFLADHTDTHPFARLIALCWNSTPSVHTSAVWTATLDECATAGARAEGRLAALVAVSQFVETEQHEYGVPILEALIPHLQDDDADERALKYRARLLHARCVSHGVDPAHGVRLAREVHKDAVADLGTSHEVTLQALSCVANALGLDRHHNEAMELYGQLLPEIEEAYGPTSPQAFDIRGGLVRMRYEMGDSSSALEASRQLMTMRESARATHGEGANYDRIVHAWLLGSSGEPKRGIDLFLQLIEESEDVPHIRTTAIELCAALVRLVISGDLDAGDDDVSLVSDLVAAHDGSETARARLPRELLEALDSVGEPD